MAKALVANAGDVEQVRKAARSERFRKEQMLNDWRTVIALPEGRRVLWHLLGQCKVFESIMETNARIYYNAGRQDFGHFIVSEITAADPHAWIAMQQEAGDLTDVSPSSTSEPE